MSNHLYIIESHKVVGTFVIVAFPVVRAALVENHLIHWIGDLWHSYRMCFVVFREVALTEDRPVKACSDCGHKSNSVKMLRDESAFMVKWPTYAPFSVPQNTLCVRSQIRIPYSCDLSGSLGRPPAPAWLSHSIVDQRVSAISNTPAHRTFSARGVHLLRIRTLWT
jgi:hypothetical protein